MLLRPSGRCVSCERVEWQWVNVVKVVHGNAVNIRCERPGFVHQVHTSRPYTILPHVPCIPVKAAGGLAAVSEGAADVALPYTCTLDPCCQCSTLRPPHHPSVLPPLRPLPALPRPPTPLSNMPAFSLPEPVCPSLTPVQCLPVCQSVQCLPASSPFLLCAPPASFANACPPSPRPVLQPLPAFFLPLYPQLQCAQLHCNQRQLEEKLHSAQRMVRDAHGWARGTHMRHAERGITEESKCACT